MPPWRYPRSAVIFAPRESCAVLCGGLSKGLTSRALQCYTVELQGPHTDNQLPGARNEILEP